MGDVDSRPDTTVFFQRTYSGKGTSTVDAIKKGNNQNSSVEIPGIINQGKAAPPTARGDSER